MAVAHCVRRRRWLDRRRFESRRGSPAAGFDYLAWSLVARQGRTNAVERKFEMATPIVIRSHVGHNSPSNHDEILHAEIRSQVPGIDGLRDNWFSRAEKCLFLHGEVGPVKVVRSEHRDTEDAGPRLSCPRTY